MVPVMSEIVRMAATAVGLNAESAEFDAFKSWYESLNVRPLSVRSGQTKLCVDAVYAQALAEPGATEGTDTPAADSPAALAAPPTLAVASRESTVRADTSGPMLSLP